MNLLFAFFTLVFTYTFCLSAMAQTQKHAELQFWIIEDHRCSDCSQAVVHEALSQQSALASNSYVVRRFERDQIPDWSRYFMALAPSMSQNASWPLLVILDDQERLVWVGGGSDKGQIHEVIEKISLEWRKDPQEFSNWVRKRHLESVASVVFPSNIPDRGQRLLHKNLQRYYTESLLHFDAEQSKFRGDSVASPSMRAISLLRLSVRGYRPEAAEMAALRMASYLPELLESSSSLTVEEIALAVIAAKELHQHRHQENQAVIDAASFLHKVLKQKLWLTSDQINPEVSTYALGLAVAALSGEEEIALLIQAVIGQRLIAGDGDAAWLKRFALKSAAVYLEDYASLVWGLIESYRQTPSPDARWLVWAQQLQRAQDSLFYDKDSGLYFESNLPLPGTEQRMHWIFDHDLPSANSLSTSNLIWLSQLFDEHNWLHQAQRMVGVLDAQIRIFPLRFHFLILAVDLLDTFPSILSFNCDGITPPQINSLSFGLRLRPYVTALHVDQDLLGFSPIADYKSAPKLACRYYVSHAERCFLPQHQLEVAIQQLPTPPVYRLGK